MHSMHIYQVTKHIIFINLFILETPMLVLFSATDGNFLARVKENN